MAHNIKQTICQATRQSAMCLDFNLELGLLLCCFQRSFKVFTVSKQAEFKLLTEKDTEDNIAACSLIRAFNSAFVVFS